MIPFASPLLHAGAIPGGKTYAEFVDYVNSRATNGLQAFGDPLQVSLPGSYRVPFDTSSGLGVMTGSTWLSYFRARNSTSDTSTARALQHALPSQAVWQKNRDDGLICLIVVSAIGTRSYSSLNRNGYLSSSGASGPGAMEMTEVAYWDNGPMRIYPNNGLGPEPLDW